MDKTSSNEERISEPITKDAVLRFIQGSSSNPDRRTIARAFGIKGSARIELKRILKELSADGLIADAKRATKPSALSSVAVIVVTGQDRDGDLLAAPLHWNEAS